MIVSFSIANFRSFSAEQTFSLVASSRLSGNHDDHLAAIPDSKEKVLRAAVLYGANGAGKSNLFKALQYLKSLVLQPRPKNSGTGRQPFRFAQQDNDVSSFDLQFVAADRLYRLGIKVTDDHVVQEWLDHLSGGRQRCLYERVTDQTGKVTINGEGLSGAHPKVRALATVGGPQNQSFLATINATLNSEETGDELGSVLDWFSNRLRLVSPDAPFVGLGHELEQHESLRTFAGSFLRSAATGVDHLEVARKELASEDFRGMLPEHVSASVTHLVKGEDRLAHVRMADGRELLLEREGGDRYSQITIKSVHEHEPGKPVAFDLQEESDGTRRLLNLIPALHHLQSTRAVYFIDEIDRSLHPILVREFLQFFLKSCANAESQVIVTTHESNLLDQELLRRDEIWFAEKDQSAATRLYSLLDFKVRNDLEIRKHYLQGRFGAVPFLGNLEALLPQAGQPE